MIIREGLSRNSHLSRQAATVCILATLVVLTLSCGGGPTATLTPLPPTPGTPTLPPITPTFTPPPTVSIAIPSGTAGSGVTTQIQLTPLTDVNPVGGTHTLSVSISEHGGPGKFKQVTFTVTSGPHKGDIGTAATDANGVAVFTFAGSKAGVDTIVATAVDIDGNVITSNPVTKVWAEVVEPPVIEHYVYSAKFVCGSIAATGDGVAINEPPVKPGNYATAINIQNYSTETVEFTYRTSVARAVDPDVNLGPVSQPANAEMDQYQAMEIDCPQIVGLLEDTDLVEAQFLKGFVTIESGVDLQVVGVYTTTQTQTGESCVPKTIILNTGYDQNTGNALGHGVIDDDWDLTNAPGDSPGVAVGNAVVKDPYPFLVGAPLTDSLGQPSRWIELSDGFFGFGTTLDSSAEYTFAFEVPVGCDQAHFVFDYLMNDTAATFFLNGVQVTAPGGDSFQPTQLDITESVQPGPNTLTVVISDIAAEPPGLDLIGTVSISGDGAGVGGAGISIDVEYLLPLTRGDTSD